MGCRVSQRFILVRSRVGLGLLAFALSACVTHSARVAEPTVIAAPIDPMFAAKPELEPLLPPAKVEIEPRPAATVHRAPPIDQSSRAPDPRRLSAQVERYAQQLGVATYAFNVPSPIKVARPAAVHFQIDPTLTPDRWPEQLARLARNDKLEVKGGQIPWAPVMRASLSGDAFDIVPSQPDEQTVVSNARTAWSWDITAKRTGDAPLHLSVMVVFPGLDAPPRVVKSLSQTIRIEPTPWWLFDAYFDKYWRWLLGGLGAVFMFIVGLIRKRRHDRDSALEQV